MVDQSFGNLKSGQYFGSTEGEMLGEVNLWMNYQEGNWDKDFNIQFKYEGANLVLYSTPFTHEIYQNENEYHEVPYYFLDQNTGSFFPDTSSLNSSRRPSFISINYILVKKGGFDIGLSLYFRESISEDELPVVGDLFASVEITLNPVEADKGLPKNRLTWKGYKRKIYSENVKDSEGRYIYRGHSDSEYRLKTSMHRKGIYSLGYYLSILRQAEFEISKNISRIFNLDEDEGLGEFMFLGQHYGFPTPLLDFTKSPFIAAYFAFKDIPPVRLQSDKNKTARIYCLDSISLKSAVNFFGSKHNLLKSSSVLASVVEFRSLDNERSGPQQGVALYTVNSALEFELTRTKSFFSPRGALVIQAFDIPWRERDNVMSDLALMGITSESMFPGLEGAFKRQAERLK
jgi:hypothetical protein